MCARPFANRPLTPCRSLVIFDNDGTLADSLPPHVAFCRRMNEQHKSATPFPHRTIPCHAAPPPGGATSRPSDPDANHVVQVRVEPPIIGRRSRHARRRGGPHGQLPPQGWLPIRHCPLPRKPSVPLHPLPSQLFPSRVTSMSLSSRF